jgi:RHS repeat-associated protein
VHSNNPITYDDNGNATSRFGSPITWSSYNYPTSVTAVDVAGTENVQFSYGPDRSRWMQNYDSGTETTYYVGGLLEQVETNISDYRQYVYAGGEPVAILSRKCTGVNTWSYLLSDHIGSVAAITSSTSAVDITESFTSFGARRNPTTWSGAPASGDLTTIAGLSREGFTFQTALGQSMGLNHMNGRVQDAITGRFLSADPNIPDPTSTQSYNRFSYVSNNPLSLIDPSGFNANNCATDALCGGTESLAGAMGESMECAGNCMGTNSLAGMMQTQQFLQTAALLLGYTGDISNLTFFSNSQFANLSNGNTFADQLQIAGSLPPQSLISVFQGSGYNASGSIDWPNLVGSFTTSGGELYYASATSGDCLCFQPVSGLLMQQAAMGDLKFAAAATVVSGAAFIAAPYVMAGASAVGGQVGNLAKVTAASFGMVTGTVSTDASLILGDSQAMATILGDAPEALSALDKAMSTSEALTEEIESAAGGDAGGVATDVAESELEALEELAKSRPKPMK